MAKSLPGEGESLPLGQNPGAVKAYHFIAGFAGSDIDVPLGAIGTVEALTIPAGTLIIDVRVRVITDFNASVTLSLGDFFENDGYLSSAEVAPQTKDGTNVHASMSVLGTQAYAGGVSLVSPDRINIYVGGATVTVGKMEVVVIYSEGARGREG